MSKAFQHEKRVVTECIKLYQAFPCLWDSRKEIYANREARDHAYSLILEKYQKLYKEATVDDLKKKIVNMRNSYRREHKRVLREQKNPTLWYYHMMTFLNEVMTFKINEEETDSDECLDPFKAIKALSQKQNRSSTSLSSISTMYLEDNASCVGSDKRSISSVSTLYLGDNASYIGSDTRSIASLSTLYLGDNASFIGSDVMQIKQERDIEIMQIKQESSPATPAEPFSFGSPASFVSLAPFPSSPSISERSTETESFGTALGQQLRYLDDMQKTYAEKLISDVIYNARLKRLTFNSHVKL